MARYKFDRSFFIPKNGREIKDTESAAVAYVSESNGHFNAVCFGGKRQKPDSNYYYRTEAKRDLAVAKHFEGQRAHDKFVAERRAKRSKPTTLKVDDILSSSWGYGQTNVDFYQVVEVKPSGKSIVIREIAMDQIQDGFMSGKCTPKPSEFVGDEMLKRVSNNGVSFASYRGASKWSGRPMHNSWYH